MSSGESTTCPLCQAVVESGDALQLHYLTNCSGYDKVSSEQPRSKLTAQSHHGDSGTSAGPSPPIAQPVAVSRSAKSSIQFMWQPLSEISYRTVTLLASFDVGSVELSLDTEGGHYASDQVRISNGSYEGQLVIGDSFVHPVKKFTIEKDGDIVVLQFDISHEDQQGSGYGSYGTSQYGTGQVYKNPSYGGGGGGGGTVSYSNPIYDQTTDQYGRKGGGGGQYDSRHTGGSSSSYMYSSEREHGISNYKNKGETAFSSSERSSYHPPTTVPSQQHTAPSQRVAERLRTQGAATSAAVSSGSQVVTGAASSPRSSQTVTNSQDQLAASQVIEPINIPITTSQLSTEKRYTGGRDAGFSVGQLQQTGSSTTSQDLHTLRQQLGEVTKERDSLKQTSERVNAQWEGKVRRLQQQLRQAGGDPPLEDIGQTAAVEEAQVTIISLENEVTRLRRQVNDGSQATRDKQEAARELVELKDRNTALEQQMMEYIETIKDQNKYIQSLSSTGKVNDVEVLRYQQEAIHLTEFAKKQQLENEEALSSLKKKIDFASDVADQNQKIHLLNVNLTGELEDYRSQTKRLLIELRQKDDEIVNLRQALAERGASGSDKHDLELASLKEKCEAWQEEVERLAEFREEVQQLREENTRLTSDNEELTRDIQSVLDENEKKQVETAHKLSEYDTLMSRFVQLQQTRVTLEKELQPLREERAAILMENATLREGSQPQSYTKLKQEHKELKKYCDNLQAQLDEQSYLISAHQEMQQKLNQATDPERLQSIRERMERYKQERDTARKQVEELKVEQEKATEELSTFAGKSEQRLETAEQQMYQLHEDISLLTAKAADYESRMKRYREERNKLTTANKQLKEQLATLQVTVNTLIAQGNTQDPSYLESMLSLTANYSPELQVAHSPTREHQPSSPLPEYQPEQYTTDDDQYTEYSGQAGSPVGKVQSSLSVEGKAVRSKKSSSESQNTRERSSATPKKGKDQHFFDVADVKTKTGIVSMYIQKPTNALNPKYRPRVVVKRSDDLFEAGTLMFVGTVGGKELAGVQLDLRQMKPVSVASGVTSGGGGANLTTYSDGTYKDGKRYFKCPIGFGLYVPLSRVYIEMESAAV